jgi:hypothetical protein
MGTEMSFPREFFPERLPLRGEITAWLLGLIVLTTATVLRVGDSRWAGTGLVLAGILVLSAGSISFGNWMDRQTVIRLDRTGVSFSNGVRHTVLAWSEILTVRVLPAQLGARQVQIVGSSPQGKAHFEFRTLVTVHYRGQERGRTGFADGNLILETILRMADMQPVPSDNPSYSYYARK